MYCLDSYKEICCNVMPIFMNQALLQNPSKGFLAKDLCYIMFLGDNVCVTVCTYACEHFF